LDARAQHARLDGAGRDAQQLAGLAGGQAVQDRRLDHGSQLGREPAEEFVKGLQDRGMHELALEYLELLKASPVADDAIRQQIPYLRGMALIEQSRQSADATARSRLLDQARQELEKFAETNPHSVQGAEAQLQLATVQMSRGQELVAQSAQLPNDATYSAQKRKLGHDARVLFTDAHDTFARAEGIYSAELEKLPPAAEREGHNDAGSKRQEYRARVAQLRFLAAQTQFESAQSYPPGTPTDSPSGPPPSDQQPPPLL